MDISLRFLKNERKFKSPAQDKNKFLMQQKTCKTWWSSQACGINHRKALPSVYFNNTRHGPELNKIPSSERKNSKFVYEVQERALSSRQTKNVAFPFSHFEQMIRDF